jgi:RimJ/RimL family protein N-acetyltransferase
MRGRNVVLGPLDPADLPTFTRWINDPSLRPFLNRPWPTNMEDERRRMETLIAAQDAVGFSIRLRENGTLIGRSAIWNIHRVNRSGLLTIFIGEEPVRSKGLGREATALTTVYAMDLLNLNRLELEVFAYNDRAIRCYEGLGFQREGSRREVKFHEGAYHDAIMMAILARDWRGPARDRFRQYLDHSPAAAEPAPDGR